MFSHLSVEIPVICSEADLHPVHSTDADEVHAGGLSPLFLVGILRRLSWSTAHRLCGLLDPEFRGTAGDLHARLVDLIEGNSEQGVKLTVGILCRFKCHPLGRFRVYVTTDPDPLHFGIPAHVVDAFGKAAGARSETEQKGLVDWIAEADVEYQNRRWAAKGPFPAIPADKKMEELQKALKYAEIPIEEDPRLIRFRKDVEMSARQAKNPRLTAAQDLTWALINNPAFLFNH